MSTRATYQFLSEDCPNTTIYIHYDGYPNGAAMYLHNMLLFHYIDLSGLIIGDVSAETFLRANIEAKITNSHEAHDDTEYRYTINPHDNTINAINIDYYGNEKTIFTGQLSDFINKYRSSTDESGVTDWAEEYHEIDNPNPLGYKKLLICKTIIEKNIEHSSKLLRDYQTRMKPDNPNICSLKRKIINYKNMPESFYSKGRVL